MSIDVLRAGPRVTSVASSAGLWSDPRYLPALFNLTCVQCRRSIAVLVYKGPDGADTIAMPATTGGFDPEQSRAGGVLSGPGSALPGGRSGDRGGRDVSRGTGAAAVRTGPEGTLNSKITALENDPPDWAQSIRPEFLRVIKDLGNAAIHPNDGDVSKQAAFHAQLLREVRALFVELLDEVYEQPARRASRLDRLRQARDSFGSHS